MATKLPQPQRLLFTALHSVSVEKKTSKTAGPLERLSLILSIQDPDWIFWYVFSEGYEPGTNAFDKAMTTEGGVVLDSERVLGGSPEGFPFTPTRPRAAADFTLGPPGPYSIQPRARLWIQGHDQDRTLLKVGMTVFLPSGPENLSWPRVPTFGVAPRTGHLWGFIGLAGREELLKGLRLGPDRFRLPSKAARKAP